MIEKTLHGPICPNCDGGVYADCEECAGSDYAVFDPTSGHPRRHPDYGYCDAILPNRTEEEARQIVTTKRKNGKGYELRRWPRGEKVGE